MSTFIERDWPLEHVARLRLHRPEVRNAINWSVLSEFHTHLDALADKDVRGLILTGTDDTFSVGADLREIKDMSPAEGRNFSEAGNALFERIESFPCPVVAAVNGYALGGGCELACACDLRYAVSTAQLGQPETSVGMIPGWGGTIRLPRIVGRARAKELILTGTPVAAPTALDMGLVHQVFDPSSFEEEVLEHSRTIAVNAPIANREAKRLLNRTSSGEKSAMNEERLALGYCMSTHDQSEAVSAFLDNREPSFENQ